MPSIVFSLFIILLVIVAYWAFLVFPKQREYKKHIKYLNTIDVGDKVITYGGLIGVVRAFDDDLGVARLEITNGVEIEILSAAINRMYDPEEMRRNLRMAQGLPPEAGESNID